MLANGTVPERTPLSVLLYHAAMTRSQSLSSFADELDIGAISLRQFILGKTQRPRQKTLEIIGEALDLPVEEVRRRMSYIPEAAPGFGDWLDAHMKGKFSRAKLTRETKISDGALRNYLSGQTLPDSDQAQRLAEVLEVEPLEVARVIVANEVIQKGGEVAPPGSSADEAANEVSADAIEEAAPALGAATLSAALLGASSASHDESQILGLWRQLHPQARRATLSYIAMLLAER
ncbi:MAG: XRE family transcriptional regulator [Chloroflexales bacterium]|nr:XRE family transcriptional regulator [Chloroflexales bacterium]